MKRVNGCQCPWNWEQTMTLLLFVLELIATFILLTPLFSPPFLVIHSIMQQIIEILFIILTLAVFVYGTLVMITDPTESVFRVKYD